jgi:uncharacterized phage-associated protein
LHVEKLLYFATLQATRLKLKKMPERNIIAWRNY